ncbi:DUF3108 domain-containing protein [Azospirillum sp.]|uniref:DUF3108 domain-containing protein n=1 Tax=Azospirillum sp. TaxID=34012 RepID=UPI00261DF60B|nr:DUF3108 domain-containing protein [Azospirillum sp.]
MRKENRAAEPPAPARPRAVRLWLTLCAVLALPDLGLAAPVTASYRVHVGGIAVLDATILLDLTDQAYRIDLTAQNGGFLAKILPWKTLSRSDGAIQADRLIPARHSQSSVFREKPRSVALTYEADGRVAATVTPPPEEDDRPPVPESLRRATYDPLSAGLLLVLAAGRGETCARVVPVYDGRRRYDMRFDNGGTRPLAPSRYSMFSGLAQECRASIIPIAGQAKPSSGPSFWRRDDDATPRPPGGPPTDVWLAPVLPDAPPLPVRLETDSAFGAVVIHLTGVARAGEPTRAIP